MNSEPIYSSHLGGNNPHKTIGTMPLPDHMCYALAQFDYDSSDPDLLSFSAGQVLNVVGKDPSGWWEAISIDLGRGGWISSNFMHELDPEEVEEYLRDSGDAISLASMATYGSLYPESQDGEETPIEYQLNRPDLPLRPPYERYSPGPSTSQTSGHHISANLGGDSPVSPFTSGSSQYSASPVSVNPQLTPPTNAYESFSHYYNPASVPSRPQQSQHPLQPFRITPAPGSPAEYWQLTPQQLLASPSTSFPLSQPQTRSRSDAAISPQTETATVQSRSPTLVPIPSPTTNLRLTWGEEGQPPPAPSTFLVHRSSTSLLSSKSRHYLECGASTPPRPPPSCITPSDVGSSGSLKRWYMNPGYSSDELVTDKNCNIVSGTLEALVERLTEDIASEELENRYRDTFFTTYRTFSNAKTVVGLLCKHYELLEPPDLTQEEFREWRACRQPRVRSGVLNAFTHWVRNMNLVEFEGRTAAFQLREFLGYVKISNEKGSKDLAQLLHKRISDLEQLGSPASVSPTFQRKSRGISMLRKPAKGDLFKYDSLEIAQQMTIMQYSLYNKIFPQEIIAWSESKHWDKSTTSTVNLFKFVQFGSRLQKFIMYVLLSSEPLSRRREMATQFLKVGEKCQMLGNFHAVSAIIEGLRSDYLRPLTLTWANIDKRRRLERLRDFIDPKTNFEALRAAHDVLSENKPCVPFIQIYFRAIADVEGSHVAYVPRQPSVREHINFAKCQVLSDLCRDALRFQNRRYEPDFVENPELTQYIEEQLEMVDALDDRWFLDKVERVKGLEQDLSDIRRAFEQAGF